ncbi:MULTISPECIES: hypothetical protein [unclassified Streptomyces]|uniref:hypothetical protein n=1 Tax=unclassified Streptomyces TaxID=2593676 RepID=UPI00386B80BC
MLRGLAISGLNPKALLLYFSLFPQFIRAGTAGRSSRGPGCSARCAPDRLRCCLPRRRHPGPHGSQNPFLGGRVITRISGAMVIAIGALLLMERLTG